MIYIILLAIFVYLVQFNTSTIYLFPILTTMGEFSKFFKDLFIALTVFLLVCSPILFFNTVVDPYGIFFYAFKHIPMEPNKRYMKMMFLKRNPNKFDSFIFGSSRANAIDPGRIPNKKYFNMTYSNGMPSQHYEDIQELLRNGVKIKNLLIGIDYSSLLENSEILESDLMRKKYPVSFIEKILFYKAYLLNMPDWEYIKLALKKSPIDRSTLFENGIIKNQKLDSIIDALPLDHLSNVELSVPYSVYTPNPDIGNNIKQIEKIVQIAKANLINLIVFINPTQSTTYLNFNMDDYLESLKSLSKITDYYDFSGLNSVAINNMNFYESSHFREHVGNLIIARIFNLPKESIPTDFGCYVTKENVYEDIRLQKQWFKEYLEATTIERSYQSPIVLGKLHKLTVSPVYSLHSVNELNTRSIKQPLLLTTPWIKMTGDISPSTNFGKNFTVYIQIGNRLFKTNCGDPGTHEKLTAQITKNTKVDWHIMIPASFIKEGLQTFKLVVLSEDKNKFSITGPIFEIDHLLNKPIKIPELKIDTSRVNFSIDLINRIKTSEFIEVTDEKNLYLSGWAAVGPKQKPIGGVVVSIDGKAYLSQFIIERPDLSELFNNQKLKYAGWGISIPIFDLSMGEHELCFRFLNNSKTGYYSEVPKIKFKKIKLQVFDFFKGIEQSHLKTAFSVDVMNENVISKTKQPLVINEKKIKITGWAIDQPAQKLASDVIIEIDGKDYKATLGTERPDVAKFQNNAAYKSSGWKIEIPTSVIGKGEHILTLKIVSDNHLSYFDTKYSLTFLIP